MWVDGSSSLKAKVENRERVYNLLINIALKGNLQTGRDQDKVLFSIITVVYMKDNGEMAKWMGKAYFLIRLMQLISKVNGRKANKKEEEL